MNHSKKHGILNKNEHVFFFAKNEEPKNYTYPNLWSVKPFILFSILKVLLKRKNLCLQFFIKNALSSSD